jgi:hypothetical protein
VSAVAAARARQVPVTAAQSNRINVDVDAAAEPLSVAAPPILRGG